MRYEAIVEGKLGSFNDVELPRTAMDKYNMTDNWLEYISMVSDIRTICPLQMMAKQAAKSNPDNLVSFYVATQPRSVVKVPPGADASTDLAAIFGVFRSQNSEEKRFEETMQNMFYTFVTTGRVPMAIDVEEGIYMVDKKMNFQDTYRTCNFWEENENKLVPDYGKLY